MGEVLERMRADRAARLERMYAAAYVPPEPLPPAPFLYRGKPYREARFDTPVPASKPEPEEVVDDECWLDQQVRAIPVRTIIQAVSVEYQIPLIDLASKRRTKSVIIPRQVAMYLARKLTTRSYPEIGRCFGGKDHTTVLHAYQKIKALLETDADLVARVARLEARVSAQ